MKQTLLIELLTEELPPKALEKLSTTFADEVFGALKEQHWQAQTAYARLMQHAPFGSHHQQHRSNAA